MINLSVNPNDYDKHFILTANIDLAGEVFTSAVIAADMDSSNWDYEGTPFTGVFDGDGFSITNLTIAGHDQDYIGLFGCLGEDGQVKKLGLKQVDIVGRDMVGIVCGWNEGGILKSGVSGQVTGSGDYIGGLCGANAAVIDQCSVVGAVEGNLYIGGLCGENDAEIFRSFATAAISGYRYAGGLCGDNSGQISQSYAVGAVTGNRNLGGLCGIGSGAVSDSFWDTQTTGRATSSGGTGKTTAEMQDIQTFLAAGWDFVDVWIMLANNYPRLLWAYYELSPDLDENFSVNIADLALFLEYWLDTTCTRPDWCGGSDFNTSGKVDLADFAVMAEQWGVETLFIEDFEMGDFSKHSWQHSGNAPWVIVSDTMYEGSYATKSGVISHGQSSTLEVTLDTPFTNISFYRKVSSESGYDYLRFYIDDVEIQRWSGSQDWTQQTYTITPGQHTFKWSYTKDGSVNSDSDCAWIDNITLY